MLHSLAKESTGFWNTEISSHYQWQVSNNHLPETLISKAQVHWHKIKLTHSVNYFIPKGISTNSEVFLIISNFNSLDLLKVELNFFHVHIKILNISLLVTKRSSLFQLPSNVDNSQDVPTIQFFIMVLLSNSIYSWIQNKTVIWVLIPNDKWVMVTPVGNKLYFHFLSGNSTRWLSDKRKKKKDDALVYGHISTDHQKEVSPRFMALGFIFPSSIWVVITLSKHSLRFYYKQDTELSTKHVC